MITPLFNVAFKAFQRGTYPYSVEKDAVKKVMAFNSKLYSHQRTHHTIHLIKLRKWIAIFDHKFSHGELYLFIFLGVLRRTEQFFISAMTDNVMVGLGRVGGGLIGQMHERLLPSFRHTTEQKTHCDPI